MQHLHTFAESVAEGVRAQLGPGWRLQPTGAGLWAARGDRGLVVDLQDLAVRHPDGPGEQDLAGVAACLRRWEGAPPDFAEIGPRLLPYLWRGDELPAQVPLLRRPWHAPLWVGYGVAEPECTLALTTDLLLGWGASAREVDGLALRNLQGEAVGPSRVVAGVLYTLGEGEHRERNAARVLLPAVMERLARICGARSLLVGLPHRGLAVILRARRDGDTEEAALSRLNRARALMARQYRSAAFPLSRALLGWSDGQWSPLQAADSLWTPA